MNTTNNLIILKDIDLPFDFPSETFENVLAEVGQRFPSAFIRIRSLNGPGGGWPNADVIIPNGDVDAFLEFFGNDSDTIEFIREFEVAL